MELSQSYIKLILGLKIRQLRLSKKMSLSGFAKECGLSVSYLNEIESGKKYPKSEKLMLLANSLGTSYDKLVSLKLTKQLAPIGELLESNILKKLPLDHYGIDINKFISLMSSASMPLSALVSTIIELAKSSELSENNFSRTALRTYKEINDNYFLDLEKSVNEFLTEYDLISKKSISLKDIESILKTQFNYEIDYDSICDNEDLSLVRAYVKKGSPNKLYLNSRLSESQIMFIVTKELAYNMLKLTERSYLFSSFPLDNFDHLLNNYRTSYWANALLMQESKIKTDLIKLFTKRKWDGKYLIKLIDEYKTSPEMLFQRIANLAPQLGLSNYFFIRFNSNLNSDDYYLSKEVRLNIKKNPGGYQSSEHYCRRWISIENLFRLKREIKKKSDLLIVPGIIKSQFINSGDRFLAISLAKKSQFYPSKLYSVTIGFLLDEKSKEIIKFSNDPDLSEHKVNDTCETCNLTNCSERVAPPSSLINMTNLSKMKEALANLT